MKKSFFLFLSLLIAALAYGQESIYFNPDFAQNPFANISRLAIMPVTTPISSRNITTEHIKRHSRTFTANASQNESMGQLKQLQNSRALEFQNDIYSSLLKKSEVNSKLQNVRLTNAILNKNKIDLDNLQDYTPEKLAKILNVDAILYGSITFRVSGYSKHSSNIIHLVMSLNNNKNAQIWQYNISEAKSRKKSEDNIIGTILKKAMKEFPTSIKKTHSKFDIFHKHKH